MLTACSYGNSETKAWDKLRPLSQPQFSTQKLKPQASDAVLSFVQLPTNEEYLRDTIGYLMDQTDSRELVGNVDYVAPDGTLHITLFDPKISTKAEESINAETIREGLGMVPTKLKAWERSASDVVSSLTTLQFQAKEGRKGMWEYGDITED